MEALLVCREMTAFVLEFAVGGSFETQQNPLYGGHILAMVAHNLNILALHWWLIANCVSCWMESAEKTVERLDTMVVKAGNHTHVAVDIAWVDSQINSLCQWQFVNCFPMILNWLHPVVAWQICHLEEPCLLSLVGIRLSTCSVKKMVVYYYRCKKWYRINQSMVECIAGSSDLLRNEGLRISHSGVTICGVSLHLWSMKPTWLRKRNLSHTHPAFLCYMLESI